MKARTLMRKTLAAMMAAGTFIAVSGCGNENHNNNGWDHHDDGDRHDDADHHDNGDHHDDGDHSGNRTDDHR